MYLCTQMKLIVITGPTGVGKTATAIAVAKALHCDIINADSRQVYRGIPIATATPTAHELAQVPHHLIACKELDEPYNAWQYEQDVMSLLPSLWASGDMAVLCGGSMMYVDAVCNGIDNMPSVQPQVRQAVKQQLAQQGLESLVAELERLDPAYAAVVDRKNPVRVCHAIELCRQTGVPYSTLRTGQRKPRPFDIIKVGLTLERNELYDRINRRVDAMMSSGLEDEARRFFETYGTDSGTARQAIGCKEFLPYFRGEISYEEAVEAICRGTRRYAKRQLTWFRRMPDIQTIYADAQTDVFDQAIERIGRDGLFVQEG